MQKELFNQPIVEGQMLPIAMFSQCPQSLKAHMTDEKLQGRANNIAAVAELYLPKEKVYKMIYSFCTFKAMLCYLVFEMCYFS